VASNYSTPDGIEALLFYHILRGAYPQLSITNTPQFIPTLLKNSSYTNVTTGQVVEAMYNNSATVFVSAINHVSNLVGPLYDIVFIGGLIHIVHGVLVC
jgi:hypothetical protein